MVDDIRFVDEPFSYMDLPTIVVIQGRISTINRIMVGTRAVLFSSDPSIPVTPNVGTKIISTFGVDVAHIRVEDTTFIS